MGILFLLAAIWLAVAFSRANEPAGWLVIHASVALAGLRPEQSARLHVAVMTTTCNGKTRTRRHRHDHA